MMLFILFLIGAALAVAPWFFPVLGVTVQLIGLGVGVALLIIVAVAAVVTKLYRKASANMAFVRTGMGGAKVIQDGGAIVVPVIHQVIPVSMETMRLNVERRGPHALITKDNLRVDLSSNGLTLESVTISALDQTDPTQLQERNVFDAQGLRKIAEITQAARVQRNEIEREAERQVAEKNVHTTKKVLDLQRDQAEFEAEQKMKVANVRAGREREVAEFKLTQDEAVSRRDIEKMKSIETAEVERTLVVEQAQIAKKVALTHTLREQETAEIQKKQAVEVAERTREVTVAEKERERATAQAKVLDAEAAREKAKQSVVTVTVAAEADREAQKKLIGAQQQINEKKLREQTDADVMAYMRVKEAESSKQAAELEYEARLKLAEGQALGLARQAEGEKALKMVDINVERERVNVEQARVDVERLSLSNRSEFEDAALKFELEKLRIEADKQVRIAAANALGNMLSKAQMQIFGDPETMTKMSQQFMKAAALGTSIDGLMSTMPERSQELLVKAVGAVAGHLKPSNGNPPAEPADSATSREN